MLMCLASSSLTCLYHHLVDILRAFIIKCKWRAISSHVKTHDPISHEYIEWSIVHHTLLEMYNVFKNLLLCYGASATRLLQVKERQALPTKVWNFLGTNQVEMICMIPSDCQIWHSLFCLLWLLPFFFGRKKPKFLVDSLLCFC